MNKKIVLAAAMLPVLWTVNVGAEVTDVKVEYRVQNRDVAVISGRTSLGSNTKITLSIFKSGKNYEDITSKYDGIDVTSLLANTDVTTAGEDGTWSFEWEPSVSADYDLYISENKTSNPGAPMFIAGEMGKKFESLKTNTKQQMQELFSEEVNVKSFYPGSEYKGRVKAFSKIGDSLFNIRRGLYTTEDVENYLDTAVLSAILCENKKSDDLDALLSSIKSKGLEASWYDAYNNASEAVKAGTAETLAETCIDKTIPEFNNELKTQLILKGVRYAANWTEAQQYLELFDSAAYRSDKQKAAIAVVGKDFTTDTLSRALEDAVSKQESGGGSSSSRGKTTPVAAAALPPEPTDAPEEQITIFNDVNENHWAYDFINYLRWNDIADGDENGNFNPEEKITRAEFTKILCCAFNLSAEEKVDFGDVSIDSWYYSYVQAAASNKIVLGNDAGNFCPTALITREDIAVMAYRLINLKGIAISSQKQFEDSAAISEYAKEAVSGLAGIGILNGENNMFRPSDNATRAEAAAIVYKVLKINA